MMVKSPKSFCEWKRGREDLEEDKVILNDVYNINFQNEDIQANGNNNNDQLEQEEVEQEQEQVDEEQEEEEEKEEAELRGASQISLLQSEEWPQKTQKGTKKKRTPCAAEEMFRLPFS